MKELKSLLCQYLRTKETDFYLLPAYSIDTCNKEVDKLYKLSKIFSKISLTKICMDYLNFLFLCLDSRPTSSTDFRYLEDETLIVIFPSLLTLMTSNCKLFHNRFLLYRNQSTDLLFKSMDWFFYVRDLRRKRGKEFDYYQNLNQIKFTHKVFEICW